MFALKPASDCHFGLQPVWRRPVHSKHGICAVIFESTSDWEFWLRIASTESFLHLKSPNGFEARDTQLSQPEARRIKQCYVRARSVFHSVLLEE